MGDLAAEDRPCSVTISATFEGNLGDVVSGSPRQGRERVQR